MIYIQLISSAASADSAISATLTREKSILRNGEHWTKALLGSNRISHLSLTVLSMTPRPISPRRLGTVSSHGSGWLVQLKIKNQTHNGPQRSSQAAANEDLKVIRQAKSRDDAIAMLRARWRLAHQQRDASSATGEVHASPLPNDRWRNKSTDRACLRNFNIEWPAAQLMISGAKTTEIRHYPLDHKNLAKNNEEMWLIETPGPWVKANIRYVKGFCVSTRPRQAHIVGTISFDKCEKYTVVPKFRADETHHRIRKGDSKDWHGQGARYAWRIRSTRKLRIPLAIPGHHGNPWRRLTVTAANYV